MATINREHIAYKRKNGSSKASYKEYQKYYINPIWKENREHYLSLHPLCEICLQHERVVPAECVHHKIPFSRGVDERHKIQLLTNDENFMSLCKCCHKGVHRKDDISRCEVLDTLSDSEYEDVHHLKWMK